jgi:hypothetical protein
MDKTWMPTVAGILGVVAGVLGLLRSSLFFVLLRIMLSAPLGVPKLMPALMVAIALPLIASGILAAILAIVGGAYTLRRETWGLGLAGSIAAVFCSAPLGIAAIVFMSLSKNEFK